MDKQVATFAGGCFWCTEAVFERLIGVLSVVSGYTGGNPLPHGASPTYEQVSTGTTNYAEAIQITFDPSLISFETLLQVFWKLHDPTTLNRQGADVGTQYRSAIFYHSPEQKKAAEISKAQLEKSHLYKDPIVTHIEPFTEFFTAEGYHQEYYKSNTTNPYCRIIIDPKITKLYKEFKPLVKSS